MQNISSGSCAFEIRRPLQLNCYEHFNLTIMNIDLHLTYQIMNNYLLLLHIIHIISLCLNASIFNNDYGKLSLLLFCHMGICV